MRDRVENLCNTFDELGIDAMLIASPENRQYMSGFTGSNGILFIHKQTQMLVTDFRYKTQAALQAVGYEVIVTSQFLSMFGSIKEACDKLGVKKLGFEADKMTVAWADDAQKDLSGIELVKCPYSVDKLRQLKSQEEINCIQRAQTITDLAYQNALPYIRRGMTEYEIATLVCGYMAKCGCKTSFNMIAASGPNSAMPHAVISDRVLQDGDFLTMDFGCRYNGYCSDMTRTVAIGTPSEEMVKVYNIVLEAQLKAMELIKPGVNCWDVDNAARSHISDNGYGDFFGHGLGHSIGLANHEEPRFSTECREVLEEGICISVEPGIYLPGKFGVRIEDIVHVMADGYQNFTTSPKELIIL
ncbi:Xaa-Pro peptidase family protein [Eubacteriales bacterium OttesenSCG-928-M02]|nr:Xaa-Pro peptidase family protein [Eubacteriales bacterium OttesenSCG-928-M02]